MKVAENSILSQKIAIVIVNYNGGKLLEHTIERTDYLAQALDGAAKVLAVSDYQAGLYRRNGFANIALNKNGVTMPGGVTGRSNKHSSLHVAYLGGVCRHKGYYFLKDALEQAHYPNLQLRVIDFDAGSSRTEQWGDNTVELVPPFDMDDMADFYSEVDVIIAPSMWPESFGLVSREALLMDKWVVAADAGGLAEDIVEDVNGHVFPLGDRTRLGEILVMLNDNSGRYRERPDQADEKTVTSVAEQIEELEGMYQAVLSTGGTA